MKLKILAPPILALAALTSNAHADSPSAEGLFAQGQAAYDSADYKGAVAKWQASYDMSKESDLLFNIAQAKRLSGDCTGAIVTYRRFIAADADPTSEQHKLAEDLALELEGLCPAPKPAASPPQVVPTFDLSTREEADRGRPDRTWKIAGLVTSGAGVVTLAVGLGFGRRGTSIGDEITDTCRMGCDWEALKDKDTRGRRYVTIGRTLDVIGVAAIAGGAIFYYLGIRQEAITVAPASRDGGGVISWNRAW